MKLHFGCRKALISLIGAALTGSMALSAGSAGVQAAQGKAASPPAVKVIVDGKQIDCSPAPQNVNGRILVPMKAVFEALGYTLEWDDYHKLAKGRLTAADGSKRSVSVNTIRLSMAVWEIRPADERISFLIPLNPQTAPIKNVEGRILLPAGVIAEAIGCEVKWDDKAKVATINTAGAKISPPKGWVEAIAAHYAKYAPDQTAAKQSWIDDEAENQRILSGVSAKPTQEKPTESKGDTYKMFSTGLNKSIEYAYKSPEKPKAPPVVGSVPAKILIDESKAATSYPDPNKKGQWIQNLTEPYFTGVSAVVGGCNWYAGGRFNEIYGIPLLCFDKFLNADAYLDAADLYDEFTVIRDVNDVRDYSLVVYGKGKYNSGHVGFMEYVERDASGKPVNVYITEANVNNATSEYRHGIDGAVEKLSMKDFLNQSKPIIGYIIPNPDFFK